MDTLPVVEWLTLNAIYTLTTNVTAFEISPDEGDGYHCGPICELPEGTALEVCGGGFSNRTVRVRHGDCYYHVFWRDLASAVNGDQAAPFDEPVGLLRLSEKIENQGHAKTVETPDLVKAEPALRSAGPITRGTEATIGSFDDSRGRCQKRHSRGRRR
jgi:hypothetical protein